MEDKKLMVLSRSKEKNQINYSRDYRYLGKGRMSCFIQFFLVIIPVFYAYFVFYDKISYYMTKYANEFIKVFTGQDTLLVKTYFFRSYGEISYVSLESKNPSFEFLIINFVATLLGILILSLIKTKKNPIVFFLLAGLYIHLCSVIYFIVFPNKFPYDLVKYSELYMKHQLVIWLLIMVVFWFTTSIMGKMLVYRIFTFISLIIVEGILGFARYVLYLTFLAKCSCLYMAVLYFMFGFLMDFIIMVAFYAIYMKRVSKKLRVNFGGKLWKWS